MEVKTQYKEQESKLQLDRFAIDLTKFYAKRTISNKIGKEIQKTTARGLSKKFIARANLAIAVIDAGISVAELYYLKKQTKEIKRQCDAQKNLIDIQFKEIQKQKKAQIAAEKKEMDDQFHAYKSQLEHFANEISRFETEIKDSQIEYNDLKLTVIKQKELMNTLNKQIEKFADLCKYSKEYIMYCDRYSEEMSILSNLLIEFNNL